MPIDFAAVLLDPVYAALGVPAKLVLEDGASEDFDLTVIDKTSGVEVSPTGHVTVPTVLPAAAIRRTELTSLGLNKDDLVGGTLTFNGYVWTISNTKPEPNPSGEGAGEVIAMLTDPTELASS